MRAINKRSMIFGIAVVLGLAACGATGGSSEPADTPAAAAPSTTMTETTTASSSSPDTNGSGTSRTYATRAFNLPFDLTVPTWLETTPSVEQPNFVTWVASAGTDRAIRFLIPVNVYPPGSIATTTTPTDYVAYLLGQADHGAHFSDQIETTVDGRPATIVTATTDESLDGSLGCREDGLDAADCVGLQPDLVLRIAVIDNGGETLLAWLKGYAGEDMTAGTESFAHMLTTLRFADRPVEAPVASSSTVAAVATSLDGTYRYTLTAEDALAHGTPNDKTPESQATFPWVFTMTMDAGTWQLANIDGQGVANQDAGHGSYTVEGDHVVFIEDDERFDFAYTVDADDTLHLDPQPPINPGTAWVLATNPWAKID